MMTTKARERKERLMPGGVPRWIRCYDSEENESAGRYTVVFTGRYRHKTAGKFIFREMSAHPFHQGIGQHGSSWQQIDVEGQSWAGPSIGRRCQLGVRIPFESLPDDCQQLVLQDYCELWGIEAK